MRRKVEAAAEDPQPFLCAGSRFPEVAAIEQLSLHARVVDRLDGDRSIATGLLALPVVPGILIARERFIGTLPRLSANPDGVEERAKLNELLGGQPGRRIWVGEDVPAEGLLELRLVRLPSIEAHEDDLAICLR